MNSSYRPNGGDLATAASAGLSAEAQTFNWLLDSFCSGTAGVVEAVAVSADGLLMAKSATSDHANADRLAAVISGMTSLRVGWPEQGHRGPDRRLPAGDGDQSGLGARGDRRPLGEPRYGGLRNDALREPGRRGSDAATDRRVEECRAVMRIVGGSESEEPASIRPYLRASTFGPAAEGKKASAVGSETSAKLRPFVLTSGRVTADPEIGLETQVTTAGRGGRVPTSRLSPELRAIVTLCDQPISVAEISARLKLHLGVVKILVGDLRATGYLDVHNHDVGSPNTPELILRVIRGLSAIA
jgi:hypothetical protein